MKILIKKDLFNIAERLKKIDKNYYVAYNLSSKNFEVYNSKFKNAFCFVAGKSLNSGALIKAHKTDVKNLKNIIKQIDAKNFKLEVSNQQNITNKAKETLNEVLNYINNSTQSIM